MAFKIESGLLDACALAILSKGDTYGYEITQETPERKTLPHLRPALPGQKQTLLLDHKRRSQPSGRIKAGMEQL